MSKMDKIFNKILLEVCFLLFTRTVQSNNRSLYLVVLLPFPDIQGLGRDPSWNGGLNVLPAVRLAVKDIQSSDLLNGYTIELLKEDCGCNYTNRARISFVDSVFFSKKQIVGVIGPGCSASAVALAPLINYDTISLINIHGAGTPQLENRIKYPNSFSIFGSSKGIVEAIIELAKNREWKKVGVLYDSSRVFQSTIHDDIIKFNRDQSKSMEITSGALSDYEFHLDQIRKKNLRIIFLLAGPNLARNFLCVAYHMNMVYPKIQWILVERLLVEFEQNDVNVNYRETMYNCTKETIIYHALNNSVLITYRLKNENATTTYANISYREFEERYKRAVNTCKSSLQDGMYDDAVLSDYKCKPSPWGSMYYDAVWALAVALNKSQQFNTFDLNEYGRLSRTRKVNDTLELQNQIFKLNFTGVSGQVSFNSSTGSIKRAFNILLVVDGIEGHIGNFPGKLIKGSKINHFLDDEFPTENQRTSLVAVIIIGLFTFILLCSTVFFHILTVYYRNDYFVRAASMKLSQIAYIGCYLLLLTSFIYVFTEGFVLKDTVREAFCHSTYVFCSIGFTFVFGTLCAKEWRLYRISNHYLKPGKCLSDQHLFVLILLATSGDILINCLWIVEDPFHIDSTQVGFNETKATSIIVKHCHSKHPLLWYLAIYVYNSIFLILASVLAILAQKIYIVGFQTKVVFKMTYFTLLVMGIGIPTQIVFIVNTHTDRVAVFAFDSTILNIVVLLANVFLFFTPLYLRLEGCCCKQKYKLAQVNRTTFATSTKH